MFSYQKELLTKKVLISLLNLQIQVSTSRSTATGASIFLAKSAGSFYHKILEHEVDGELSLWVDKCSSCGLYNWRYKDLSMSHDQKAVALLFPMEKCLISFYHRVAFIAQFDDSSPSVTRDKELATSLQPEAEHPTEPFQWCLPAVQIWRF